MEHNSKITGLDYDRNSINIKESNNISCSIFSINLLYPCDLKHLEEFNQMRDKGEMNDEFAKALRNDDIDTFQSIISKNPEILINKSVLQNIFEPFIINKVSYLDYAAAYSSVKCFKYLLLNNDNNISQQTFNMAIYGGNSEIIRIVDNKLEFNYSLNMKTALLYTIQKHQNDLFDWIFETKFDLINQYDNLLLNLIIYSIFNCNIHSLVQFIDNKFSFKDYFDSYQQFLDIASEKGFSLLLNFLTYLIKDNSDKIIQINLKSAIYFDNIYIYKKVEETLNEENIENSFLLSIKLCRNNITKYFLEKDQFVTVGIELLRNCFQNDSKEILNYVIEKVKNALNSSSIYFLYKKILKDR